MSYDIFLVSKRHE